MEFVALTRTAEMISRMGEALSEADKEYVVQFAFRTGDGELTNKLIDELTNPDADRQAVYRRFETMVDFQPDWIRGIENLLVSLEMYRVQEERTVKALSALLSAYGINLSQEELKKLSTTQVREQITKNEAAQR